MRITTRYLFIALSTYFFVGCSSSKLHRDSTLFQHKWVLSELNGTPVQTSGTDKDAALQFLYDGMKVTGNGGCNTIAGSFTAQGDDLIFGPIASTKMYCPDSKFEDAFLSTLSKVNKYELNNTELLLKHDKTIVAKLMAK